MNGGATSRRRRALKIALVVAVGALALALAAALALELALRSESVRRSLLSRAGRAAEARLGLSLTAADFRLRPWSGQLAVDELEIGAPGSPPALGVRHLDVSVRPLSLLGDSVDVRWLRARGVRLDLAAPLPLPAAPAPGGEAEPGRGLEVRELTIEDLDVRGAALPDAARPLAERWDAADLELRGRSYGGRLELGIESGRLLLGRGEAEPLALDLTARLAGPAAGPLTLEALAIEGPGLSATVRGTAPLAAEQPFSASFELRADPAALLPGLPVRQAVDAEGEVDLRRGSGRLRLRAPGVAAEVLAPWVGDDLFTRLQAAGTRLAVDADLELWDSAVAGEARLDWLAPERPLLAVRLSEPAGAAEPGRPRLAIEARLLPAAPGERRLAFELAAGSAQSLSETRLENGRLTLDLPDAPAFLRQLGSIWRDLVPEAAGDLPPGALRATARFAGPLLDPRAEIEGSWRSGTRAEIRFDGDGFPRRGEGRARLAWTVRDLGAVAPGLTGSSSGRLEAEVAAGEPVAALVVEAAGIGPEGGAAVLDALHLEARSEGRALRVTEIRAAAGERRVSGTAALELRQPLGRARAELRVERPAAPIEWADLTVELRAGSLELRAPRIRLPQAEASLEADLPLATLAAVPGLEALAGLPLERARGPLAVRWELPETTLALLPAAEGTTGSEEVRLAARGDLAIDLERPAASLGTLEISRLALRPGGVAVEAGEPIRLRLESGRATLEPARLAVGDESLELAAHLDLEPLWRPGDPLAGLARELELRVSGGLPAALLEPLAGDRLNLESARLALVGGELRLTGGAAPARPLVEADLELVAENVIEPLRRATVKVELRDGVLSIPGALFELADAVVRLDAEVPLAGLAALPGLGAVLETLPVTRAEGPVVIAWEAPAADWSPLLPGPAEGEEPTTLRAAIRGRLRVDPGNPRQAAGELTVSDLEVGVAGHRVDSPESLRLELAEGELRLAPFRFLTDGMPLAVEAGGRLAEEPGAGALGWLESVSLQARGSLLASLLNPYLAGGEGEGLLAIDLEAGGPPGELVGSLAVSGPGSTFFFLAPYPTTLGGLELRATASGGSWTLESATARLNDGSLRLGGTLDAAGELDLRADLGGVRYRLDYGLLTVVDGSLRLTGKLGERLTLAGEIEADRGILTRDISLSRDLVLSFLAPVDLTGTEETGLEGIELDLTVTTRQGVRVKNNLADLLVRWDPIAVRGTLAAPLIKGQLEVDPGGLVSAFGQTLRLDSASLEYSGEAGVEPRLELVTTSSLEDPSIGQLAGADPLAEAAGAPAPQEAEAGLAEEITTFVGEKLASRLSESLGGTRLSLRPVTVFGEVDPGARLTVSHGFSPNVALAASIDLRNAERQTYLLDLHDFNLAPRLTGQLFTSDLGEEGATLQQTLELGGGAPRQEQGPRIRAIRLDRPAGVSRRGMRRAVGYGKGDRLGDLGRFEVEVEVAEYLRHLGYADARVKVAAYESPGRRRGVDLEVAIDPGPRVAYRFEGDRLPAALRRSVATLYRADFYEPASLVEMRDQAVRAYRSLGFIEPEVEVRVEPADPSRPASARTVVVEGRGGRKIELDAPVFEGLGDEDAAELASRFATTVQRVELAAGLPAAERRLLDALRGLGYRDPKIRDRRLSEDGKTLAVALEPGERRRIASVELVGAREEERDRLLEISGLRPGDPVRTRAVASAAVALEEDLLDRGYPEADVKARLDEVPESGGLETAVVLEVRGGELYRVEELEILGIRATRPAFARKLADIDVGEILRRADLLAARRELYRTGLFSSVMVRSDKRPEGLARVVLEVDERSRFRVAYGARWDSEDGGSLVVDVEDRNFLGTDRTLGLRLLLAEDDRRFRFFTSVPRLFGSRGSLELFTLWREQDLFDTRALETTLQFSYPLSRHATGRIYGRYKSERFVIEDPFGFFPPFEVEIRRPFLGLQLIYDRRDDKVMPSRGLFASADLSVSEKYLGSDFRYARFFGQVNRFQPAGRPGGRPLTWAQSLRLGAAEAFDQELLLAVEEVPLFAGGEFSVRGYVRESLGPPGILDLPSINRMSLFVVNEELRYEVLDSLTALVFFDAGNVWTSESGFSTRLFKSAGLGVRAVTPFGLLRLDLAAPLNRREIDPSYKVYFGFGNTF